MLPSMKSIMIEQATFTYSPLGKALDYQTKKQVDSAVFKTSTKYMN